MENNEPKKYCSFCGRDHTQVIAIIESTNALICSKCVFDCVQIISENLDRIGKENAGSNQT